MINLRKPVPAGGVRNTILGLLAAVMLVFSTGNALAQSPEATGKKAEDSPSRNPLWVIENGNSRTYVLATIQLMSAKSYPLSDAIEKAYSESDVIVFEADMRALNREDAQIQLTQGGTYSAGLTLKNSVSPATYARFEKRCETAGLPAGQMARFKPWFCGVTFTMLEIRKLGFDLQYGPEQYFYTRARKDGKEAAYFESIDEHFGVFTKLPKEDDEQLLLQTLDALDLARRDGAVILKQWQTGDVDGLTSKMLDSFEKRPALKRRVLSERNRKWAQQIGLRMKSGKTALIVVGAAHALGEEGLIELLKKSGHAIRQL